MERGNPDGVRRNAAGKLTVRKAELPSGRRMAQEANAAGRKATGIHNRPDRDACPRRKAADVDQVSHLNFAVKEAHHGAS